MEQDIYYAVHLGYIVTAELDGSVTINARIVAKVDDADTNGDWASDLVRRANAYTVFTQSKKP